jgi:hypothetical protein
VPTNRRRIGALAAFAVLCVVVAVFAPAIPQPLAYHLFADRRVALGTANFADVASNAGFLAAGIAGLAIVLLGRAQIEDPRERWPWVVFFAGLVLTAVGSAYYHLAPDNERLFWDRLPITVTFAGLFAAQVADRMGVRAGILSLAPMVLLGAASVVHWRATERAGAGNMVPYVIVQGSVILLLIWITLAFPSRYTRSRDVVWIFAWYVLAKAFEFLDEPVFHVGSVVSGHTLKHVAAAMAGFVACAMLMRRTPVTARP